MGKPAMEWILESKDFGALGLKKDDVSKSISLVRELRTAEYPKASKDDFLARVKGKMEDLDSAKDFTIFGTSGIRGKVEDIRKNPVSVYRNRQVMSYKFAYLYGKAYGAMLNDFSVKVRDKKVLAKVAVGMDSRMHSLPMAACVMEGLAEEGIHVNFLGVAPTPYASLVGNAIIITASHNPAEQDGIKAFIEKRPITLEMEKIVECGLRVLEDLESEGRRYSSGKETPQMENGMRAAQEVYRAEMSEALVCNGLVSGDGRPMLTGTLTPLDLAYGAAAAWFNDSGQFVLSPQIEALLATGTSILGYGILRDGEKTNYGIGAAYIYGETAENMAAAEVGHFARGQYGYGQTRDGRHHSRSFIFGRDHRFRDADLNERGLRLATGETVFLDADANADLAGRLEREIAGLTVLPACSVDCDEDRYLATDPELSRQSIPYLSGDTVIALFSHFLKNRVNKILFTVESGMALQKILDADKRDYEIVTVGDRAIADWIYDCGDDVLPAGGEPSGHVIFKGGKDDPIYTHVLLLGIMLGQKKPLPQTKLVDLIAEATQGIEEVYTDRAGARPKSAGIDGITLREKRLLELRRPGTPILQLSDYAKEFVPWCAGRFAEGWRDLFAPGETVLVRPHEQFESLVRSGLTPPKPYGLVPIAELRIGTSTIQARLRVSDVSYFGPNDITLVFFEESEKGEVVCGEMISRNSGTSPKNSCYIKLWPNSHSRKRTVDLKILEAKLKEMGGQRMEHTNAFVLEKRNILNA